VATDENITPLGVALTATVISVVALFLSIGPCVRQEKVEAKVEHLEERLDVHLRDHGR
jgi:hypothetical protein